MSERVRNVNSTDTLRTGAAEAGADPDDENRIDFGTLFPAKGDSRRPPEWFGRALLYVALAVIVFMFCWRSWGDISYLVLDIIISLFLALAVEPLVVALVAHGWKRGVASAVSLVGVAVVVGVLLTLFGNMFVQQMIAMVRGLPAMYEQIREFVDQYATFKMPEISNLGMEIFNNIQTSWVTDFAGTAMSTVGGLFSFLLNLMTVVMTAYYISAAGPKLRRSFCQWLAPNTQRRFLLVWTVAQGQISSFLFSRSILALINATCTAIFLEILHVPYWLPLALFCGVVSQFIPTVGTYIGGALPGAVRLGQPRMDVRRGGAGVHHRLPADREPDSLAEDFAAHDGYQRGRRLPRGAGVRLAVRRVWRVPGAARSPHRCRPSSVRTPSAMS